MVKLMGGFSSGAVAQAQLPALYEPALVGITPMAMRLRGFERLRAPEGSYSVVQEWHCIAPKSVLIWRRNSTTASRQLRTVG